MSDDGLFEALEPEPIKVGDRMKLRTIWGEETCRVEEVGHDAEGWPIVTVSTNSGDRATVSRASLIRGE